MSSETKVALITGGSSGIGAATAKFLSERGYKIAFTGTKQDKIDRTTAECISVSPEKFQPLSLKLDFMDPANGEMAVNMTVEHFGRIDVLINNAGIFNRTDSKDPKTYELYRRIMSINTDSTVRATLAAIEHLKKTNGIIIFISSVASVKYTPGYYAYAMSKSSMSTFAKCLAIDLAPSIRVNIVSPGPVATQIFENLGISQDMAAEQMGCTTLQNRIGTSEEIAKTIGFLISDEAAYINGHELFIDGGYLLHQHIFDGSKGKITSN